MPAGSETARVFWSRGHASRLQVLPQKAFHHLVELEAIFLVGKAAALVVLDQILHLHTALAQGHRRFRAPRDQVRKGAMSGGPVRWMAPKGGQPAVLTFSTPSQVAR